MDYVGGIPKSMLWADGTPVCHTDRLLTPIQRQTGDRKYEAIFPFASRCHNIVSVAMPRFWYDGFSVPRMLHSFQSPMTGKAAVTVSHDGGYGGKLNSRLGWDDQFYNLLRHYGESELRATVMYRKVRRWGWIPWRRRSKHVQFYRDHFLVFENANMQAEEIKMLIRRGNMIGNLLIEIKRTPNRAKFYEDEILSIRRGDIDEVLISDRP